MEQAGKCCQTCGFLALRRNATNALEAAPYAYRSTGESRKGGTEFEGYFHDQPFCFVGAEPIGSTWTTVGQEMPGPHNQWDENLETIRQCGRECDSYVHWHESLALQEHLSMNMLLEQREWQARESAKQRKWEASQERVARRLEKKRDKAAKCHGWQVAGFAAAVAMTSAIAGAVAGALLSRHSEPIPAIEQPAQSTPAPPMEDRSIRAPSPE